MEEEGVKGKDEAIHPHLFFLKGYNNPQARVEKDDYQEYSRR